MGIYYLPKSTWPTECETLLSDASRTVANHTHMLYSYKAYTHRYKVISRDKKVPELFNQNNNITITYKSYSTLHGS